MRGADAVGEVTAGEESEGEANVDCVGVLLYDDQKKSGRMKYEITDILPDGDEEWYTQGDIVALHGFDDLDELGEDGGDEAEGSDEGELHDDGLYWCEVDGFVEGMFLLKNLLKPDQNRRLIYVQHARPFCSCHDIHGNLDRLEDIGEISFPKLTCGIEWPLTRTTVRSGTYAKPMNGSSLCVSISQDVISSTMRP